MGRLWVDGEIAEWKENRHFPEKKHSEAGHQLFQPSHGRVKQIPVAAESSSPRSTPFAGIMGATVPHTELTVGHGLDRERDGMRNDTTNIERVPEIRKMEF